MQKWYYIFGYLKCLKLFFSKTFMETLGNEIMPKLCSKFYCEKCHYGTSKKSSYDNHKSSLKHLKSIKETEMESNVNENMPKLCSSKYTCENDKSVKLCERYYS